MKRRQEEDRLTSRLPQTDLGQPDISGYRQWLIDLGLTPGSASSYASRLKKLPDLNINLDVELIGQDSDYVEWAIDHIAQMQDKPKKKSGLRVALRRYAKFCQTGRNPAAFSVTQLFRAWQSYAKLTHKFKAEFNLSANITGDVAEILVANGLGLKRRVNGTQGFDLVDRKSGKRYQVKSRVVKSAKDCVVLGITRTIDFDFLVVVFFSRTGAVLTVKKYARAHLMPFMSAAKNVYQNGFVLRTTKAFQTAGEDCTTRIVAGINRD